MNLINTREAKKILEVENVSLILGKPKKCFVNSSGGGKFNLYDKERVLKIKAERDENLPTKRVRRGGYAYRQTVNGQSKKRHCLKCGRLTLNKDRICVVCKTGSDPSDPYGTMEPPKKRSRPCKCGNALYIGEIDCLDCQAKKNKTMEILDAEYAYGGMVD